MIIKTKKSISKRFYLKFNNNLKRSRSNRKHILSKKRSCIKRRLKKSIILKKSCESIFKKNCFN